MNKQVLEYRLGRISCTFFGLKPSKIIFDALRLQTMVWRLVLSWNNRFTMRVLYTLLIFGRSTKEGRKEWRGHACTNNVFFFLVLDGRPFLGCALWRNFDTVNLEIITTSSLSQKRRLDWRRKGYYYTYPRHCFQFTTMLHFHRHTGHTVYFSLEKKTRTELPTKRTLIYFFQQENIKKILPVQLLLT